jgi:Protein of unknown function (DUF1593)/WD40-like Beta Propeller Repeat
MLKKSLFVLGIIGYLYPLSMLAQSKPKVWIYTDMSDKNIKGREKEGSANDPDDISAMAGYLLMCNEFDTKGIVVTSTHRKEHATSPNQADWANQYFGTAYQKDVLNLNKNIGGYPATISFVQSCIKESAERYMPEKKYADLSRYNTVQSLVNLAQNTDDIINVLCWGSLTEPAILVNHCLSSNKTHVLKKLRFIAHWTNSPLHQGSPEKPENVANCREDAAACAYLKQMAGTGKITYYECGAIGQHGIVSGSPKGEAYFNQFKISQLGKIFAEGKFAHNSVDHSDAATYWTLLGNWGVGLKDIKSDGTNTATIEKANEDKYTEWSQRIHDELLRRVKSSIPSQFEGFTQKMGIIHTPQNLPDYIRKITDFGERAAWSPDGKHIAFMAKTYGDAYEINVETKHIRPLTHHFPHYGFQRVQYLSNGDYLLTGADFFDAKNPGKARHPENCQVWILKKDLKSPPTALGIKLKEGIAIARHSLKIAWVEDPNMYVAEIKYDNGKPHLDNKTILFSEKDLPTPVENWRLEPQDFRPPLENELIFNAHFPKYVHEAEVMGFDIHSKTFKNYSKREDRYDEPEGIFPDGNSLLVESNRHRPRYKDLKSWNLIDLYRLKLDGSGQMERITYFNDNENHKASNPVVSPDGRYIAFQYAFTNETTGIGHGILLFDLNQFYKK